MAHNTYGPHDDKFYSHLKALEEEYTALRASGYAGEGFYSEGRRLGSSTTSASSQNPRLSDARKKALAAANARRKAHIGGPPQKLGGNGNGAPGASIREKIAAATERRIRDAQTCGAGSKAGDRGRLEREAEDAIRAGTATTVIEIEDDEETENAIIQAAIDLIAEAEREEALQRALWGEKEDGVVWIVDDDVPIQVELPTTQTQPPPPPPPTQTQPQPQAQPPPQLDLPPSYEEATTPIPTPIPTPTQIQPQTWECEMCTLINPTDLIRCEVCSFERDLFTPPSLPPTSSLPPPPPPPLSLPLPPPPKKQKVRFAGSPVVIPEKRILVKQKRETWWTCENCTLRNEADWWTCCACGVMKLTS